MSRIHDALQRAQREGQHTVLEPRAPDRLRESAGPSPAAGSELRPLAESGLPTARFGPDALAALARGYESIERFCVRERGFVTEPGTRPARSVLVVAEAPGLDSSLTALVLATTLVEKARWRVALIDAEVDGPGLSDLCQSDGTAAGLWELVQQPGAPERSVWRTEFADLFYVPLGTPLANGEGRLEAAALRSALAGLLERFPGVVIHAGFGGQAWARALAPEVDAVLVVGGGPDSAAAEARPDWVPQAVPVERVEELRRAAVGGRA